MAISLDLKKKKVSIIQFLIEAIDGEGRRYCPSTQNAIEKVMKHLFSTAITVRIVKPARVYLGTHKTCNIYYPSLVFSPSL